MGRGTARLRQNHADLKLCRGAQAEGSLVPRGCRRRRHRNVLLLPCAVAARFTFQTRRAPAPLLSRASRGPPRVLPSLFPYVLRAPAGARSARSRQLSRAARSVSDARRSPAGRAGSARRTCGHRHQPRGSAPGDGAPESDGTGFDGRLVLATTVSGRNARHRLGPRHHRGCDAEAHLSTLGRMGRRNRTHPATCETGAGSAGVARRDLRRYRTS
jgi:hypothetical protein